MIPLLPQCEVNILAHQSHRKANCLLLYLSYRVQALGVSSACIDRTTKKIFPLKSRKQCQNIWNLDISCGCCSTRQKKLFGKFYFPFAHIRRNNMDIRLPTRQISTEIAAPVFAIGSSRGLCRYLSTCVFVCGYLCCPTI